MTSGAAIAPPTLPTRGTLMLFPAYAAAPSPIFETFSTTHFATLLKLPTDLNATHIITNATNFTINEPSMPRNHAPPFPTAFTSVHFSMEP